MGKQKTMDFPENRTPAWTPLMNAVRKEDKELIEYLIKQPGIDFSAEINTQTVLDFALHSASHFEQPNYEIALKLVKAGADIDQIINNRTLLIHAWYYKNQEMAVNLVLLLGANLGFNDKIFNTHRNNYPAGLMYDHIPEQIELTKKLIAINANQLGIDLARLFFPLPQGLDQKIATFLFESQSLNMRAFAAGRTFIRERLTPLKPVPGPLAWMQDFVNETKWQEWQHDYHSNLDNLRKPVGYGPGALVVTKSA